MLSFNQIALFLNELYPQNKWMEQPDFLPVDTSPKTFKFNQKRFRWTWSKMVVVSLVTRF